ncbi:hypothetical protein CVD28_01640 [Bacillus sp. M6-12]|uniref:hypothetical protein n=1 Tax=Bacillus sp. M6-12 TaxID=2054166 RepID=UPI000C75A85E|nr:hypothetical protein [Bacillus sp. M6-12]PLS19136.1 hypothetical protein CVD28_01640 [Bacillus sp. M6-12]
MNKTRNYTTCIEIEVFYPDSQGHPDIHYHYAGDLKKLLEICSEPHLTAIKETYQAEMVKVGKMELVSLTDDEEFPIQDRKHVIEITESGIMDTKSMKE